MCLSKWVDASFFFINEIKLARWETQNINHKWLEYDEEKLKALLDKNFVERIIPPFEQGKNIC